MDSQQLAAKVAQLETRVASLEDEGKIIKGEVKQVLTEIRSAVLARENPFDTTLAAPLVPQPVIVETPPTVTVIAAPPAAPVAADPAPDQQASPASREPVPLRPTAAAPRSAAPIERTRWSLLTISALSAWAEDAMRRLGALRVEILLDLCEASAHITPDERKALSRVTEMDVPEPTRAPSTNETAAVLRELDALISRGEEEPSIRLSRAA